VENTDVSQDEIQNVNLNLARHALNVSTSSDKKDDSFDSVDLTLSPKANKRVTTKKVVFSLLNGDTTRQFCFDLLGSHGDEFIQISKGMCLE
jgi:hypothetical protein